MYKFVPVKLDQNQQYLDEIIQLFWQNKDHWIDDCWVEGSYITQFINEIMTAGSWFMAILNDKEEFMGFVYLCRWEGKPPFYNSVQIQSIISRKFWGKELEKAFYQFLHQLFTESGLNRVQMEIPQENIMACKLALRMGFDLEGTIRHASTKNNIPRNHNLYSILKGDFIDAKQIQVI